MIMMLKNSLGYKSLDGSVLYLKEIYCSIYCIYVTMLPDHSVYFNLIYELKTQQKTDPRMRDKNFAGFIGFLLLH